MIIRGPMMPAPMPRDGAPTPAAAYGRATYRRRHAAICLRGSRRHISNILHYADSTWCLLYCCLRTRALLLLQIIWRYARYGASSLLRSIRHTRCRCLRYSDISDAMISRASARLLVSAGDICCCCQLYARQRYTPLHACCARIIYALLLKITIQRKCRRAKVTPLHYAATKICAQARALRGAAVTTP